jgi:hypothetical protein
MFVLVPAFAGLVAVAVRRVRRNYPQHLYFALHLHAAWFAAAAIVALARVVSSRQASNLSRLAFVYGAIYFVLALRRAYELSTGAAIARAVVIQLVYVVVVVAVLAATIALAVFLHR